MLSTLGALRALNRAAKRGPRYLHDAKRAAYSCRR